MEIPVQSGMIFQENMLALARVDRNLSCFMDKGGRKDQKDALLFTDGPVLGLADGMGGSVYSAEVARLGLMKMSEELLKGHSALQVIEDSNAAIREYNANHGNPDGHGGDTTIVMSREIAEDGQRYKEFIGIGDSTAMIIRGDGSWNEVTTNHNFIVWASRQIETHFRINKTVTVPWSDTVRYIDPSFENLFIKLLDNFKGEEKVVSGIINYIYRATQSYYLFNYRNDLEQNKKLLIEAVRPKFDYSKEEILSDPRKIEVLLKRLFYIHRNTVHHFLGSKSTTSSDRLLEIAYQKVPVNPGDTIVYYTDGLYLNPESIAWYVGTLKDKSPDSIVNCLTLQSAMKNKRDRDNMTLMVERVK